VHAAWGSRVSNPCKFSAWFMNSVAIADISLRLCRFCAVHQTTAQATGPRRSGPRSLPTTRAGTEPPR
jgi:hypothetical protein